MDAVSPGVMPDLIEVVRLMGILASASIAH